MNNVYIVNDDGTTLEIKPIQCQNEEVELQNLLEKNPDLLPGEQIKPEDPLRWLMVKREMGVPDPDTGNPRWSIDFFFVDQNGIPTFVECKRLLDTRARREVVGQVLEYAANGHYYWSKEHVRELISSNCHGLGIDIEDAIKKLMPTSGDSVEEFLELIQNNLQEGQVRIIFFMDKSPYELRSIVDFLNRQMERTEVLIVEARQYNTSDLRIVVPILFGYTEQARRVKKTVTVTTSDKRNWDEDSYFEQVRENLSDSQLRAVQNFHNIFKSKNYEIGWSKNTITGSLHIHVPSICSRTMISLSPVGALWFSFGHLNGNAVQENFRDDLAKEVAGLFGVSFPDNVENKFPSVDFDKWSGKEDSLKKIIDDLVEKYTNEV